MFEVAELGRKLDREAYETQEPQIREALLDAQFRLREADFSVVLVIAGAEGSGKGEVVNLMLEWLDARGIETHALGEPTSEEVERPEFYRFWRRLPAVGGTAVFFGSWYTRPIVEHAQGKIDDAGLDHDLRRIVDFEQMLVQERTLLLKFWLHVSKKQQRKKFKKLESNPQTAWRVTKRDWKYQRTFDAFVETSSKALRRTSTGTAPWEIIEARNWRYRNMAVAEKLLAALERKLDEPVQRPPKPAPLPVPAKVNIINSLDLNLRLPRKDYQRELAEYQSRLGQLSRRMTKKDVSAVVVFEGPDAAGKGGAIRRVVHALDARYYRVIPIAAPTDEELARPYLWRFWRHLPRRGHFTMFDRSWYGRVLVERIEGFCGEESWRRAYSEVNSFEEQLVECGTVVVKFWVAISSDEQHRRFKHREATGYKRHKLTEEDWRNREKWDAYEAAVCEMIQRTSTESVPWTLVEADDKLHARIKVLRTLCERLEGAVDRDKKRGKE